jgi:ABC-type Fe3+ transport system substrate-binding protein
MVKAPLEAELRSVLTARKCKRDAEVVYLNVYGNHDLFDDIRCARDAQQLPDIIASLGFGFFFQKKFRERFIDTGIFESLSFSRPRRSLLERDILDPEQHYTILAVNPMVMVVDHTKIGNRPVPQRWADILEPEYEHSVGVVGNETLSLTIYKEFGLSGIKKLRRSIGWTSHPAQMVKMAGKSHPEAPAVSVIDYFFAKTIKHQDRISIVWPDEGALAIPFMALAKNNCKKDMRAIAAFLTGYKTARICADAYYYPVYGDMPTHLSESLKLNWLGWEYLKENDLELLMDEIRGPSFKVFRGGPR